ncbi:MAG: ABC transporter ATPase, partial [Flavobacteriaceae bacterium]|nr:ABC transporter ATPase [Flavobacteriaceae bacterium]
MLVDFEQLPDEARIWIYPSNRPFTDEEIGQLYKEISDFLETWTAHGQSLKAGFKIPYKRFIIFGLDQSQASASGCSIDASVHFIQQLEQKYKVDLLDKLNVSFKSGAYIAHKDLKEFKTMIKNRSVNKQTIVFNHLI